MASFPIRRTAAGMAAILLLGLPGSALGAEAVAPAVPAAPVAPAVPAVPANPMPTEEAVHEAPAPTISQDEALALVERYFKIPEGGRLEVQLSNYGERRPVWEIIHWVDRENGSSGYGMGTVDAVTGRILQINMDNSLRSPVKGPLGEPHSEEEARNRAWALVKELFPEESAALRPAPDTMPTYGPYGGLDAYNFTWMAYHNDVPVEPSAIRVSVDRYTLDYLFLASDLREDLVYPEGTAAVSVEEALTAFREGAAPTLRYQPIYPGYPYVGRPEPELKLLYQVEIPGVVDALTGKLVSYTGEEVTVAEPEAVPAGGTPVKPASLPLTQEEAIAYAGRILDLPAGSQVQTDSFGARSRDDGSAIFLHWYDEQDSANLSLDRETGRIEYAHRSIGSMDRMVGPQPAEEPTAQQQEQGKQEAIRVVQRFYSDLLPNLKLEQDPPIIYSDGSSLSFRFQRYVNGIPFSHDGINVEVDAATGQWTSFSSSWEDEVNVAEPEGTVSADEARDAFFEGRTAQLIYQPKFKPWRPAYGPRQEQGPIELMLTYRLVSTDPSQGVGIYGIDAFTGKPVSSASEAMDREALDEKLAGHWAEGELRFMLGRGMLNPSSFDPEGAITRIQALNMLLRSSQEFMGHYVREATEVPYTDLSPEDGWYETVRQAIASGMLRPAGSAPVFGGEEELTRGEFALWMVGLLRLGDLATSDLKAEPGFTDASDLTAEERNAVAFLEALEILSSGGQFRGEDSLTQAEAAAMAVRMMEYLRAQ